MLTATFLACSLAIGAMMLGQWLLSIPLRNVSIVDIGWGLGFVLVAWVSFATNNGDLSQATWQRLLLPGLVTAWGCRLATYLAWRNIGKPEDYRYRALREARGARFVWSSVLIVFGLQGVVMWVVALPIQSAAASPTSDPQGICVGLGLVAWVIGFGFEAVGDWQLARFKSDPDNKGRVMNRGLWRYTRHPNYFGDFMVWWGLWLVSRGLSDPASHLWTIISPALMSFLLIRVSGVALLEKSMKERSPEYARYIETTSSFLPWRPRR